MDAEEFLPVIAEVRQYLEDNREWETRYAEYARQLLGKQESIAALIKQFHKWSPFQYYLCIDKIKRAGKKLAIDVRYRGQNVAELGVTDGEVRLRTRTSDTNYGESNQKYFDCGIAFPAGVDWAGKEAAAFRKHFNGLDGKFGRIPEHNIESLLLSEFSKIKGDGKGVIGIQPVRYCGFRFAMATPLKASDPKVKSYSGGSGGGIDILARTKGPAPLTVIEVKKASEAPEKVLKQAIAYTTFLLKLLRSESGSTWWRIFGFKGEPPKSLAVNAVCAMPHNAHGDDTSLAELEPLYLGGDCVKCRFIYFDYDKDTNSLGGFRHSL